RHRYFSYSEGMKILSHQSQNCGMWVLGKYVAKFLRSGSQLLPEDWEETPAINCSRGITPEFLAEHGFI
ncbi:hypothetical protein QUB08_11110, partial [Microcoleus sp. BR0-C5]